MWPAKPPAAVPTAAAPSVQAEGDYDGHHYEIYDGRYSWTEAEQFCESLGGYLACVTSAGEQAFLTSLTGAEKAVWIGGYLEDDVWAWVSGAA